MTAQDNHMELQSTAVTLVDSVLEALPAPVVLLDAEGHVLRFNAHAKAFFPVLRADSHISRFIRDPGILAGVAAAGAGGPLRQTVMYDERVPVKRHIEVTISQIAGSTGGAAPGKQPAILLHVRDLTEQERLNRLRSDFIANASHELRTPLTAVLGFIETLQGAARNDAGVRDRFLDIMARQAQRMTRLIDDLLSLSRIEMRVHLRPRDPADLNDIAVQVLNMLEPLAVKSGVALHLQPYDDAAIVLGDRDELAQVFSNLVENAIKYGGSGGNVWVAVTRHPTARGDEFAVTVRDDGPGIAASHLPRLTERFYRANDSNSDKSGTGLGLTIVKHAIARHRGRLKISSEGGKGATFTVTIMAAQNQ